MSAKVTLDNFSAEIIKILDNYSDEVSANVSEITKKVGQKGAQLLRNESRNAFNRTGKYAKGWRAKTEQGRLYTTVTIYNTRPGLPHLLEHGHAIVSGGRQVGTYEGKEHIAPVEQKLVKEYEREVKNKL